jgi:hypothetical protein
MPERMFAGRSGRMAAAVGRRRLGLEADLPDEQPAVRLHDRDDSVLPDPVLRPPLRASRIALVLMDVVDAVARV